MSLFCYILSVLLLNIIPLLALHKAAQNAYAEMMVLSGGVKMLKQEMEIVKSNYETILSSANNMFVHNIGYVEKRRKQRLAQFDLSMRRGTGRNKRVSHNRRDSIKSFFRHSAHMSEKQVREAWRGVSATRRCSHPQPPPGTLRTPRRGSSLVVCLAQTESLFINCRFIPHHSLHSTNYLFIPLSTSVSFAALAG